MKERMTERMAEPMKELGLNTVALSDVDVGDRLRAVDEAYAHLLAENIAEVGCLRQPIEVRRLTAKTYRLIAGAHRLRAAELLGWSDIPAFVYQGSDEAARLREIDENLVRHELNPLDRAVFLAQRKEVYERLHPEAKRGGDRRSEAAADQTDTMSVWSFSRDTAERCGLTDRTIRRAVSIATGLAPDVRRALVGTPLARAQKELLDLARLPPEEQRRVLPLVLGDPATGSAPTHRSVRQAHNSLTGRATPAPDGFQKLLTAWRHATAAERQAFRRWLADVDEPGADDQPEAA